MGSLALISCKRCKRQYDVTHVAAGSRVPCACGEAIVVEKHAPRAPRALNCPNCGGAFATAASRCAYCNSEITLEEKRLDSVCPECFARMASDAKFCMECGVEIRPQSLAAVPEGTKCPRCAGAMRSRDVGAASVIECTSCGGLWLAPSCFERLCDEADQVQLALRALAGTGPAPKRAAGPEPIAYLPCVRCGDRMTRRNFGGTSGVILDVCRQHGVWLDAHELEKVLEFVRKGGLEQARARELERVKRETESALAARSGRLAAAPLPIESWPGSDRGPAAVDLLGVVVRVAAVLARTIARKGC